MGGLADGIDGIFGGDGGSAFAGLADPFDLTGNRSRRQARAAEGLAGAQLAEARLVRDRSVAAAQGGEFDPATGFLSNRNSGELDNIERQIRSTEQSLEQQSRNLRRQEEIIGAANPELLKLIQGQESSTLAPLRNQRDQQKQQLVNRLRQQLGPGAETSTAGIQALNQFDLQTDNLLSGAQQQSIGQLFGITSGTQGIANQTIGLGAEIGNNFGRVATLFGNRASRIANAQAGTGSNVIGLSGANFVGDLAIAQGQGEGNRQLINTVGQILPAALSDKRAKEDIKDGGEKLDDFYGKISAKDYKYKQHMQNNILGGPDRYVSVMAQDLERTDLGKTFVRELEDGSKIVDYGKGFGVMLAGQAHLHSKVNKIEQTLGGLLSERKRA